MFNKAILLTRKNESVGELVAKYKVICKEETENGVYHKGGIDFNSVTDMEGETKYHMIYDEMLLTDGASACIVYYSGVDLSSAHWAINENTGTKIRVTKLMDNVLYGRYGLFDNVQLGQEVIIAFHK